MSGPGLEWLPAAVAVAACLVVGVAGGVLTVTGPWYHALRRPGWKPPDWAFGPIWTTIFALTAISSVMAWHASPDASFRTLLLSAYGVNAVLNIAWSGLFFRAERPDWAFVEVIFLWLSILALLLITARVSATGAALLLPYLIWVGVAAFLNRAIVRLNGPFGRA
jgi:translocator protein